MRLAYSPEHEALHQELREYFKRLITPEVHEEVRRREAGGPILRRVVQQIGADGWLGIGWPKAYGGRGMSPIEQFIFFDESMRASAPVPMLAVNSIAPTIMQFGTDKQKAIAELTAEILTDHCTLERLKAIEAGAERHDAALWAACAMAGLLGAALPETVGGSGGSLIEICLILEQQGRRVAPIPLVASVISAAMPIARFGSDAQLQRLLPGFIEGSLMLSAALAEQGADRRRPAADDRPSPKEVAVAKYWAAEGGSRIGHAALHIHSGIGIDVDYPIHRYFLWIKQIENTLGAATPQLVRLGALLAA